MNKRAFEFSFAWMFAVIVGAIIIFLAVYASTKLISTETEISDTEIGKELGILLTPIETSGEEGKSSLITLPEESEISFLCDERGNFGSQKIKAGTGVSNTFYNKYIFSSEEVTGKELYVLSKEFRMPFKVADLMFIWSDEQSYCFRDPPGDVVDDIEDLGLRNIVIDECGDGDMEVCFGSSNCDINVNLIARSVSKNGGTVYYDDSFDLGLLYGAIFSDLDTYECQIKRLTGRISELALLYENKLGFIGKQGCSSTIDFKEFALSAEVDSSIELGSVVVRAREINIRNGGSSCEIF